MTLFGVPVLQALPGAGIAANLFGGNQAPPISARLPEYQKRFDKKWAAIQPRLDIDGIRPDVAQAIYSEDRRKLLRGQEPLSAPDTARALLSANQGRTLTQGPQRSLNPMALPSNAIHDVRNIAGSIFKLPMALVHEVTALPSVPGKAAEAISTADNPFEAITNLSQVPGIRMIPGAYTAGNLARGPEGWRELATHPVFTGLDILPAVGKLAAGTKVARAALEAHEIAKAGGNLGDIPVASATNRPIKAVLLNKLSEDGLITRNAMGTAIDAVGNTRPGSVFKAGFAPSSRAMSTIKNFWDEALRQSLAPLDDKGRPIPMPKRFEPVKDLVEHARDSWRLAKEFPESASKEWVVDTYEKMTTARQADMDVRQLAYTAKVEKLAEKYANWSVEHGMGRFINGEFFTREVANQLSRSEKRATFDRAMADLRADIDPKPGEVPKSAQDLLDLAQHELSRMDIPKETRRLRATGYLYAAGNQGVDITGDIARLRKTPMRDHPSFVIESKVTDTPHPPITDLIDTVKGYRRWARAGELKTHLQNGDWGKASGIIREVQHNTGATIPGAEEFLNVLDHYRKRDRLLKSFERYTEESALKSEAAYQKLANEKAPARWVPLIERRAEKVVIDKAATPERAREVSRLLYEHKYAELADVLPGGKDELMKLADEAGTSWMKLKEETPGDGPVFVHRVAPEAIANRFPKVSEVPRTPSSVQERTWNFAPATKDASIAMTHQGMELLQQWGSEQFLQEIIDRFGKTKAQVETLGKAKAYARAAHGDIRYANDYETALADVVKNEWTAFDPEKHGYFWDSAKIKDIKDNGWYLPKHIADNLSRWHNPRYTPIQAALDPVMKLFRTALLPLSPRWHVNNIIGGAVAMTAETGVGVWRYLSDAIHMVRNRTLPEELLLTMRAQSDLYGEMSVMEGRSLGRAALEAQNSRFQKLGAVLENPNSKLAYVRDAAGKVIASSYSFNGFVDEMYRTMAYLHGKDKSLLKGLSTEAAEEAGLQLASKVLPHWAELTPLERSVMRYVFPFYGWMNFITRYALRYPFDHPIRTSIMASVTRVALDDLGEDGLPESFLGVNFFGDKGADGSQRGWRAGAMNPFSDVANNFTLVGVMGGLNPLLSTLTEQLGMKNGHLEAYPNLVYDSETGRLGAKAPGLLTGLVTNVIPQASILLALSGFNAEFKDLVRRDPAAAQRAIISAAGFPVPYRTYNTAIELAKQELAKHEGEATAQREALLANKTTTPYPGLVPFFKQLHSLTSADLSQYIPTEQTAPPRLASLVPAGPSYSQTAAAGGV